MSWTALPQGDAIALKAGYFYAAVAQVKNSHDAAFVRNTLKNKGLTIVELQDPAQGQTAPDGYRIVATQVFAPKDGGSVPWGVPWPISIADDSHLLRAWTAPQGASLPAKPPSPPGEPPWGWILLGLAGAGGATWWWLRHRRKTA
jgi:hypothetical protein